MSLFTILENNDVLAVNQVNRDVLSGISFTAEPGQRIALLGATGFPVKLVGQFDSAFLMWTQVKSKSMV